jgi:hypothetical protein
MYWKQLSDMAQLKKQLNIINSQYEDEIVKAISDEIMREG